MNYIYLLGFPPFDWIGEKIINGVASFFYTILLLLNTAIYSFISFIYNIFLLLAGGGSIFDKTQINGLVSRIYVIIGVVVLFLVAYSLLKSMINPDESLKGKKSPVNIIKDVIISIVLISFVPTIFEFAFEFQNSLLVENTIGKIIAGSKEGSTDHQNTIREGGYTMAEGVWQAFIYVNPDGDKDGTPFCSNEEEELNLKTSDGVDCKKVMVDSTTSFNDLWKKSRENTTFTNMIMLVPRIIDGQVSYIFLLDTVAGVFVLFVLLQYCLDMALRLVKLAVYELIAPIPILARIIPNEQASKVFSNWIKATLSTFTEVFIRIAILYFAVIIISTVGASITNIFDGGLLTFANSKHLFLTSLIAKALIIIGIILFVKQAPEILKEITGLDSGKYGKSLMKGIGMMTATLGGGATAAIRTAANDKDNHGFKKQWNAFKAGMGAGARGLWHGNKVEKFGDMPKAAGKAVSNTLAKRAKVTAAGGNGAYLKQWMNDKKKDLDAWKSGSFETQQKMLDEINAFVQDAKSVKSTSEGFIRDKKYLFNYGEAKTVSSGSKHVDIDATTTLSEMEAMIQSLKSSGDVDDAKMAAALDSLMNKKIKAIGQDLVEVSVDRTKAAAFDTKYKSATSKGIEQEAMVTLNQTKSAYDIVKQRYDDSAALDAVKKFKIDPDGGTLKTDNVSKLSDYLESQASEIQQDIKLEQERRKAKDKK